MDYTHANVCIKLRDVVILSDAACPFNPVSHFSALGCCTAYGSPNAPVTPGLFLCRPPGFHWLTASFWLVSQQPDICTGPWCWRAFNGIMGLVHVFLFLNVKDGPSRFRMASFYAVRPDKILSCT